MRKRLDTTQQDGQAVMEKATALEDSRRQAQQALDDYMEILAFVAHELKSPVSGALFQVGVIESGRAGEVPEPLRRPLSAIRHDLDHGHELAVSFNDLSRAETRGFSPNRQRVADVKEELTSPASEQLSEQAARNKMSFALEGETVSLDEKSSRIQDPRLKTRKGTGVGLYLARRIVELHGGKIGVEGEEGEWIQFWFELPCADPV